ncbi:MAG TPA: hypothetical protein VLN49_25125 [Gemmatimonadaceae bacterium]|nr:hypothetical protein [Gemmatimonadaceae bacterium]
MTRPVLAAAALLLCGGIPRALAQLPALRPGADVRVRATSLSRIHDGSVVRSESDTLVVRLDMGGPPLAIADRDLITLQVSHGHPGFGRRFAIGAVLGLGVGLVLVSQTPNDGDLCDFGTARCPQHHVGVGWKALVAVGTGVLGGALAQIGSREQWETVIDRRR